MRNLTLLVLSSFIVLISFGQGVHDYGLVTPKLTLSPTPQSVLSSDQSEFASIQTLSQLNAGYNLREERGGGDECHKYKTMKLTGIICASAGGGLFVIGVIMIGVAEASAVGGYYNGYGTYVGGGPAIGLVAGGAVCMVLGLAGVGVGVPFAIIGSVKSRRACGGGGRGSRDRSYLELKDDKNGLGIAYKF